MLAVKTYPQDHIDACRTLMDAQLSSYEALKATSKATGAAAEKTFEPLFLNHLVVVLDGYFMHRTRAVEGKDGNPLNEVRMLAVSVLDNGGVLAADKTIKYTPDTSVTGLAVGDEIRLDLDSFTRLVRAYFAELETRFT